MPSESLGIIASTNFRDGSQTIRLWPTAEPVTVLNEISGSLSFTNKMAQDCSLSSLIHHNSTVFTSTRTLVTGCWPFLDLAHLTYSPSYSGLDCDLAAHLLSFHTYLLSDKVQESFEQTGHLVSLPPSTRSISGEMMDVVMCSSTGYSISNPQPSRYSLSLSSAFVSTIMSGLGLLYAFLAGVLTLYMRNNSIMKRGSIKFQLFIIFGSLILYSTPLMFVREKPTSFSCSSSVWLFGLGFSITFGALLAKNWRVYRIFCQAIKKLRVVRIPDRELFAIYGGVIIIMISLLSFWQSIDPLEARRFVINKSHTSLGTTIYQCRTDSSLFPFLFVLLQGAVILYGCMLAFKSRIVSVDFTEAKPVGLSMYNYFFTLIVVGPVVSVVQQNQEAVYLILTLGVTWITTITLSLVVYTRFYQIRTGEDIWATSTASLLKTHHTGENGAGQTSGLSSHPVSPRLANTVGEVRATVPFRPSPSTHGLSSRASEKSNRFAVRPPFPSSSSSPNTTFDDGSNVRETRLQVRTSSVAPSPPSPSPSPSPSTPSVMDAMSPITPHAVGQHRPQMISLQSSHEHAQ